MSTPERTEPGFEVKFGPSTFFFPLVSSDRFKQGDVKLIMAATGMEWDEWAKLLAKHGLANNLTQQGFFAVAVQRVRGWDAEQVVGFIDELPLIDGVTLVFPPPKDDDAVPPEEPQAVETES